MSSRNIVRFLLVMNVFCIGLALYLFQVEDQSDLVIFSKHFVLWSNLFYLVFNTRLYKKMS